MKQVKVIARNSIMIGRRIVTDDDLIVLDGIFEKRLLKSISN